MSPNINMPAAILFDFDGTLFDTDQSHEAAYRRLFKEENLQQFDSYDSLQGIRTVDVLRKYVSNEKAIELAARKTAYYLESIHEVEPLFDLSLLSECKQLGHKLFIVTGGSAISIHTLLERFTLREYFDGIITAEDVKNSKPDPEPFLLCVEKYQIDSERMGVEDSVSGVNSLKAAGITSVGVRNEKLRPLVDYYFTDVTQFIQKMILS